jgi:hypothetical protein
MFDDKGVDYGVITGIGLAIASAVVLLLILSMFRSSAAADRSIALESAASEVCGDIETVASMAIPYHAERYYQMDGIDIDLSSGYVNASCGKAAFSRPFAGRIVPGTYSENGTLLWNGTAAMREYLNASFNGTGTEERPLDSNMTGAFRELMDRASMSTVSMPVEVPHGKPLIIEKTFIHFANGTVREAEPYVLVYAG